ncbi:hypothetical protein ACIQ2D_04825 [Lysinibacillus sp. NPDC097287]|uniref:hypothetical protein n=1 Tax=Lysinibacillus sp. NPDC097287 TaxID=3364144 RepID=UPI0038134EE3
MVQVNTYISNPDYGQEQLDVPLVYNIKDKFVTSTNALDYGYITIHDGKTLFEGSMEVMPEYWFIVLQIIGNAFDEGKDSWEFPTLLAFEINGEQLTITQNDDNFHFVRKSVIHALLEACKEVVMTPEIFINYHYPYKPVKEMYIKVIEELHSKNESFD